MPISLRTIPLFAALPLAFVVACSASDDSQIDESNSAATTPFDGTATYELRAVGASKCVQIEGASRDDRARAIVATCTGASLQRFWLQAQTGGRYAVRNSKSGKCLDVASAAMGRGADVIQYRCTGAANQAWAVARVGNAFTLAAQHSGKLLDVAARATADGTPLLQWDATGASNQAFELVAHGGTATDRTTLDLDEPPTGYASLDGGTTGGGNLAPTYARTTGELRAALEDAQPRVVYVMNDLDFRTLPRPQKVCEKLAACEGAGAQIKVARAPTTAACDADEAFATRTRNDGGAIRVASNKTVIGIGLEKAGATLHGITLDLANSENIIVRNLTIRDVNPSLVEAGDAISIAGAKHVWIDHCAFAMISDGDADILAGSDDVTFSWNYLDGRQPYHCGGQHYFVMMLNDARVTLHHNVYDHSTGRNPKLTGDAMRAHLFNNYWVGQKYFAVTAYEGAEARVESNVFEDVGRPHWVQGNGAIATDRKNLYLGTTTLEGRDEKGDVFAPPYAYTLTPAADVKALVTAAAGPKPLR